MSNEAFLLALFGLWLCVAVFIKFVVLLLLRWGPPGRALSAAVLMNVASSLLGPLSAAADQANRLLWIGVSLGQVLIEFVVLYLLNRARLRTAVAAAVLGNLVTFGLLLVFLCVAAGG